VKNFFRNINLLNIILITAIIILANYTVLPIFNMGIKYTLPAGKKIISDKEEKPADSHIPSPADYTMIAEENLFHPERKIPAEKKDAQSLPKPEFVLYGTLITDNLSLAYLEDLKAPLNTPGRGRRQKALKIGNTMSGFTLKEIEADRIMMVRGEESVIVPLNDPLHPKERILSVITASRPQPQTQVQAAPPKKGGAVSSKSKPEHSLKESRTPPVRTDIKKPKVQHEKQYRSSGKGGALLFGTTP
jgi:hypothetical protein